MGFDSADKVSEEYKDQLPFRDGTILGWRWGRCYLGLEKLASAAFAPDQVANQPDVPVI